MSTVRCYNWLCSFRFLNSGEAFGKQCILREDGCPLKNEFESLSPKLRALRALPKAWEDHVHSQIRWAAEVSQGAYSQRAGGLHLACASGMVDVQRVCK